jgi:FemAB-related protein (PEP-CTERM system-associated)
MIVDPSSPAVPASAPAQLRVREFSLADSAAWDDFVRLHPLGTPFHLQAWRTVIEPCFRYQARYLLAEDERSRIRAVLPLFLVKNMLIGKALLSSPFAVYGGILADSRDAARALYDRAWGLGHELGVQYIELRNWHADQCVGTPNVSRYVTFRQTIGNDEEALLDAIPRKTRYMVRKSLKQAFRMQVTSNLANFESVYFDNLRRLGTPSFPHRYFVALMERFQGMIDVREVTLEGKVVAAVLSFFFRGQVIPYYGAADPAHNALAPSNFMYFELMRQGGRSGCTTFDFGRSKVGSGSYEFKAHWGMAESPLPYEMILVRRKTLPNFSPANPRYQLPIRIWQKLPLPVTRALGPALVRLVP